MLVSTLFLFVYKTTTTTTTATTTTLMIFEQSRQSKIMKNCLDEVKN